MGSLSRKIKVLATLAWTLCTMSRQCIVGFLNIMPYNVNVSSRGVPHSPKSLLSDSNFKKCMWTAGGQRR